MADDQSHVGSTGVLGDAADTPSTDAEDSTARTGISLFKGIKNYVRTLAGTLLVDVPNIIGTDGAAGPTKALSVGGTQATGELEEVRVDSDGHLQIDVLTMPVDVDLDIEASDLGAAAAGAATGVGVTQHMDNGAGVRVAAKADADGHTQADVLTVPTDPFGADADAAVAAGAAGSIQAKLRRATQGLEDLKSLIVLAAGAALIGKVGIDQTTPGTTDAVTTKSGSVSKAENSLDFTHTVTIADAASLSDAEDLGAGNVLVGLILPSGWTTAAVSFQASSAVDGTYVVLQRADGSEISTGSVAASKYVAMGDFLPDLSGVRYLKLQSGTSGSPVAQAGGDIVTLVVRPV